ncbi:MAG: hypothetical protein IKY59_00555, partial [Oscillospiraceae bacterium]|nr:hypothetical protein [Oscillospiraceae bacterium]
LSVVCPAAISAAVAAPINNPSIATVFSTAGSTISAEIKNAATSAIAIVTTIPTNADHMSIRGSPLPGFLYAISISPFR